MRKTQSGAALIVVLIFLVAIMVIGTIAIRQSIVGLSIATNSQVQQLLTQNSDSAFFSTEDLNNLAQALSGSGMFGYVSNANDKNKELVFCYRGDQTNFFDIARANIIEWESEKDKPTNNNFGIDGYCDTTQSSSNNWFTSGRRAIITQVSVKFSTVEQLDPFYDRTRATDNKTGQVEDTKRVKIFAVSLMPAISNVSRADINTCLQSHMNEVTVPSDTTKPTVPSGTSAVNNPLTSVTECLTSLNVPFTTQVSEYTIAQNFT